MLIVEILEIHGNLYQVVQEFLSMNSMEKKHMSENNPHVQNKFATFVRFLC